MYVREVSEVFKRIYSVLVQTHRQKNSLAEELVCSRRELEKTNETCVRIAKEKETLTKEKAQLIVDLTASERENRTQSEVSGVRQNLKEGGHS